MLIIKYQNYLTLQREPIRMAALPCLPFADPKLRPANPSPHCLATPSLQSNTPAQQILVGERNFSAESVLRHHEASLPCPQCREHPQPASRKQGLTHPACTWASQAADGGAVARSVQAGCSPGWPGLDLTGQALQEGIYASTHTLLAIITSTPFVSQTQAKGQLSGRPRTGRKNRAANRT